MERLASTEWSVTAGVCNTMTARVSRTLVQGVERVTTGGRGRWRRVEGRIYLCAGAAEWPARMSSRGPWRGESLACSGLSTGWRVEKDHR